MADIKPESLVPAIVMLTLIFSLVCKIKCKGMNTAFTQCFRAIAAARIQKEFLVLSKKSRFMLLKIWLVL